MTETTWRWSDLRLHAVEQFGGELPRAQLEAEVLEVFESRPRAVAKTINAVAEDRAAGQSIRSCWAVLRARLT